MDESTEIIEEFACLLQRGASEQPPKVYKDVKTSNIHELNTVRAGDVISNVAKQIKKIQGGTIKMSTINSKTLVKTPLIPVNVLKEEIMPQFKTQVNDHNEEASCDGVTQEFETTFDQELSSDSPKHNRKSNDTSFHIIDISLKEPDPKKNLNLPIQKDVNPKFESQFENYTQMLNECIEIENIDQLDGLFIEEPDTVKEIFKQDSERDTEKEKFTQRNVIDPIKEEIAKRSEIDPIKEEFTKRSEIDPKKEISTQRNQIDAEEVIELLTPSSQKRSPSPVFSIKSSKTKSKTTTLVFNLDCFEKFEGIATSLVDEDTDLNTAKQLINSQIFDRELYLQKDEAPFLERDYSPIIELNTNSLKIDRKTIPEISNNKNKHSNNADETDDKPNVADNKETNNKEEQTNKNCENNYLEDEILFSSDEEDERSSKSFKDLPFTCALETSFYEEESQVLDKTMFVGFQTANNKSILVKTDSFGKAKHLLDAVDKSSEKTASVTELVELQSKNITDKDTSGNSLSCKDVKFVIKEETQGKKITSPSNGDENNKNEPEYEPLNNYDEKKKLPENTHSYPQSTSVSENIPDVVLKKFKQEFATVSNCINNAEQVTEEIHNLDDDILLKFQDEMTHKELFSEKLDKETSNEILEDNIGFKTASNKNIVISEVALAKSKMLLQDIDLDMKDGDTAELDNRHNKHFNVNVDLVGFKTASNKNIKMTDKALSKIKSVFHDIDLGRWSEETNITKDIPDSKDQPASKDIVVSEKELSEAKTNSKDLAKQNCEDKVVNNLSKNNEKAFLSDEDTSDSDTEPPFFGFEHKKDKELLLQEVFDRNQKIVDKLGECGNVRLTAQTKSEALPSLKESQVDTIAEEEKHEKCSNTYNSSEEISETSVFEGFKTASNKKVFISDKALERSRKIFQDIQKETSLESHPKDTSNVHDRRMKRSQEQQGLNEPTAKRQKLTQDHVVKENEVSDMKRMQPFSEVETESNKSIPISDEVKIESETLLQNINQGKGLTDAIYIQKFKGFQTASNRPIIVSEKALEKSKILFQDIVIEKFDKAKIVKTDAPKKKDLGKSLKLSQEIHEEMFKEPFLEDNEKVPFIGFQTATNEAVTISESRKLLTNFEVDMEPDSKNIDEVQRIKTKSNKRINISKNALETTQSKENIDDVPKFKGFQTTSNKVVKVSEKALEESKKMFQGLDHFAESDQLKMHDARFTGFQTASNKHVKISEKALEKSRKLFQDLDGLAESDQRKIDDTPKFIGFQTANHKEVKISQKALEISRRLFQDLDGLAESDQSKVDDRPKFKGFQTASNKEVKVSEKALEKSRKLFQDLDVLAESNQNKIDDVPKFTGFQTASRKEVKISKKALEKSRTLFQDFDNFSESDQGKFSEGVKFTGFQTASRKEVKISEKALEKSRKLFQDFDNFAESDQGKFSEGVKFTGFQMASKKEVKTSEKALQKSKKLFQDLDGFAESDQRKIDVAPKFTGFQTASKKEVKISEEALEKSKKLFKDIEDQIFTETNHKIEHKDDRSSGFQTGNNKEVNVPKKVSPRTRQMFQNLTESKSDQTSTNTSKIDDAKLKFGFSTANHDKISVSREALLKSKALFENFKDAKTLTSENETKDKQPITDVFEINTEVLNDFEMTFKEVTPKNKEITPVKSKRSGSPILSCPKAKKRKIFKIPYSQKTEKKECFDKLKFKPPDIEKSQNTFKFSSGYKKSKAYTLKHLQKIEAESTLEKNIDTYIQNFNFDNLLSFEFSGKRNELNNSIITINDLKLLFQNSVNKKLIPDGWLDIQLKLIIWKLSSYEVKFPRVMNLICTARNVMDQLKFRYDKELYNAERPILRKIMEKDDVSTRTMILCVVSILEEGDSSPPILTLTDGWYTIKAIIDKMLSTYVSNGRIQVGTKLITHGAELVGAEQAVSPWEDTSSIRLKLFGNSTRRARWDARLGCHGNGAILSHLSNVTVEGGKVPKLRVLVTRVYPPLYVDKFDDGSTVTRSERLEHLHQMKYESERQAILDKIYEEVEREVDQDSEDSEESGCSNRKKKKGTESEMAKIMKRGTDTQFLSQFTATQKDRLEEYNEKRRERIMAAIQSKVQDKMAAYGMNVNRNVVTVLKVRVVDIEDRRDSVKVTKAMLSIWRPNDAITEVVKENSWIEVLNVSPTAFRYSELQLSAGRQSIFSHSKHKESEKVKSYTLTLKRTCYPIKDLVKNPTMTTDYNEIDTIGIVFQTDPATKDFEISKQLFQNVYFADIDKNIISINFWGGLKKFGFENCLDTGQIVAGINLQKRAGNTRKSIPQYRVTEFSYFTKTPKHDVARRMIAELNSALSKIKRKDFLEECVRIKDNYSKKVQISENVSPYRFPNIDMNSSKTKMFLDTPLAYKSHEKDENFHLTGLDFESTFKQDTQDFSPKMLLRKQQLEQKMAKLEMYGEPPALSPIQIINKSKSAGKAYKSPLISKSDVSVSVANKEKNIPNQQNTPMQEGSEKIDCSPVICFNRTYVKNSDVKPVKLNFSKNDDSATDDFAEEFDYSRL